MTKSNKCIDAASNLTGDMTFTYIYSIKMPHFHVVSCHQIVIVWHGSNHTRDLLPMPSLQALVASADNYLDNQNSEGALATGKSFFVKLTKRECKTMQNACSNLSSVQRILKCITKLHKEYRIFKCLDGRIKMNQGSCASGTLFEARQKQSECGCGGICIHLFFGVGWYGL